MAKRSVPLLLVMATVDPRKRGQQFILTNVRSKLNPKRIDQKLIEDWLENNSFIDSVVRGNVVAFEKQTQFGEKEWVRLNCEQFSKAQFRPKICLQICLLELDRPCGRSELVTKGVVTAIKFCMFRLSAMGDLICCVCFVLVLHCCFLDLSFYWEVEEGVRM